MAGAYAVGSEELDELVGDDRREVRHAADLATVDGGDVLVEIRSVLEPPEKPPHLERPEPPGRPVGRRQERAQVLDENTDAGDDRCGTGGSPEAEDPRGLLERRVGRVAAETVRLTGRDDHVAPGMAVDP
jgi:hypothetical protein